MVAVEITVVIVIQSIRDRATMSATPTAKVAPVSTFDGDHWHEGTGDRAGRGRERVGNRVSVVVMEE